MHVKFRASAFLTPRDNQRIVRRMNSTLIVLMLGIGVLAGLRSMTPPAAVSWAVHLGWLNLAGSRLANMGTTLAAVVLAILAFGELIADKLPFTPNRTAPGPLIGRILTGALCGAALAVAGGGALGMGVALGAIGAIAGTFGGYQVRRQLVKGAGLPDIVVALAEDLVAVGGALLIVTRLR
jgi:uncharacterized membrane protein